MRRVLLNNTKSKIFCKNLEVILSILYNLQEKKVEKEINMNKLFIVIMVLILAGCLQKDVQHIPPDFRDITWGMSRKEVMKSERVKPQFEALQGREVVYAGYHSEYPAFIAYRFDREVVVGAQVQIEFRKSIHDTTELLNKKEKAIRDVIADIEKKFSLKAENIWENTSTRVVLSIKDTNDRVVIELLYSPLVR